MVLIVILGLVLFGFLLYFLSLFYQISNIEKALEDTVEMVEVLLLSEFGEAEAQEQQEAQEAAQR